jgi:hypothetical protein
LVEYGVVTIVFRVPASGAERVGFSYSPSLEAVLSLHVLVEPKHHPVQHGWGAGDARSLAGAQAGDRRVRVRVSRLLPAAALLAISGFASALTDIPLIALVQERIPERHLAKALGLWEAGIAGALAIAPFIAAATAVHVGFTGAFMLSGVALIALAATAAITLTRISVRSARRPLVCRPLAAVRTAAAPSRPSSPQRSASVRSVELRGHAAAPQARHGRRRARAAAAGDRGAAA